jgi:hypothetical protein
VESYSTPEEKLMLVSAASQKAKQAAVAEEGIGEDVPFTLMVWKDTGLTAVCQLDSDLIDEHPEERLIRTIEVAAICRRGFDATALTFVAEGYCATDPMAIDQTVPLSSQFVENSHIQECLTLTHVEAGNIYLCAVPYNYEVGRKMRWGVPMRYVYQPEASNQFLTSMTEILLKEATEPFLDLETWRDLVAEDVARWGFHINYGLEDDDL